MISVTKKNNFYVILENVDKKTYDDITYRLSFKERFVNDGHYNYKMIRYPMPIGEDNVFPCNVEIPTALLPWLTKFVNLPLKFYKPSDYFKVSNEDYEFLKTKFKVNVAELVDQILEGPPRSLVQLPTGTGKTFILSTLVKSYIGDGNILVMSPSSMVRNEISDRTGIPVGFNKNNKVCIVDYSGFSRSNAIDSDIGTEWMSKVDLVLYDESEAMPEGTEYIITGCTNARFFYGFSANPDAISDACLYEVERLNEVLRETFDIMKYFGVASVYLSNIKDINLKLFQVNLRRYTKMSGDFWVINMALKQLTKESFYPRMFMYIINTLKDNKVLFSLIQTKNAMLDTSEMLDGHGIPHICWSADKIEYVNNHVVEDLKSDYDKLKEYCEQGKVKVILATTVAKRGVNILQITDVLLLSGNKFGNVNQVIGRVRTTYLDEKTGETLTRKPNVYTYEPMTGNGQFNYITGYSRIRMLVSHYNCTIEKINLLD